MVIRFVWCSDNGLSEFINNPLEDFNSIYAAIGAVVKLILFEQLSHPPNLLAHTQLSASAMFNIIFEYVRGLHGAQKIRFDDYKSHTFRIGNSQQRATNVLAPLDIFFA